MLVSTGVADRSRARDAEQPALGQDVGNTETLLHPGTSSTSTQQGNMQLLGLVSALGEAG